jgi:hypothetical protein
MATATKTKAPTDESPRAKFARLAESRVTKALSSLALVEQLANPARYEYNETDIMAIDAALSVAKDNAIAALRAGKIQTAHFSLSNGVASEGE